MLRLSLMGLPLLEMSVLWGDCTDDHQLAVRELCTTLIWCSHLLEWFLYPEAHLVANYEGYSKDTDG